MVGLHLWCPTHGGKGHTHTLETHPNQTMSDDARALVKLGPDQLVQIKGSIQKRRTRLETLQKETTAMMETELAGERQALDQAVKRYNDKAKTVMKSERMRQKQRELEQVADELSDMFQQISFSVNRYVRKIRANPEMSKKEKARAIQHIEEKVNEACLSESQCKAVKQMQALVRSLNQRGGRELFGGPHSGSDSESDEELATAFHDTVVL
jgi:Mg2+ and Co2+ transporter CorA